MWSSAGRRCKALALEARGAGPILGPELVLRLRGSLGDASAEWTGQGLAFVASALAKRRQRACELLAAVQRRFVALPRVNEQDCAQLTNALAKLEVPLSAELTQALFEVIRREPTDFWKSQGLANVLNAFARQELSLPEDVGNRAVAVAAHISWSSPMHVATVCHALAKVTKEASGVQVVQVLPLERDMPHMNPQSQVLVLNACAKVNYDLPAVFAAVDFAALTAERNEQHAALVVHAFGRMRRREERLVDLARALPVSAVSNQGLSNLCLGLSALSLPVESLLREAERRIGRWTEAQHGLNIGLAWATLWPPVPQAPRVFSRGLAFLRHASRLMGEQPRTKTAALQLLQVALAVDGLWGPTAPKPALTLRWR